MSRTFPRLALIAALAIMACSDPAGAAVHRNDIPPRLQWEANGGYCGEVSFISAGLYYGQYLSQYDARIAAIGSTPQHQGELLLGRNDRRAAREMRLAAEPWNGRRQRSPGQFLRWVKSHVLRGHPVAIGVFNNEFQLYGSTDPTAGDPQYDHIVPVIRIASQGSGARLTFSDNGLSGSAGDRPYFFTYSFRQFPGDREQANARRGPLYTLPDYGRNYGIAITGVIDRDGDTLPVRIATNRNYEHPNMPRDTNARPPAQPLTLTVTVSGLRPGVDYRLYRYDRLAAIPHSHFNAQAANAAEVRTIRIANGSTHTFLERILSNDVVAYRCVRADAK